MRDFHLQIASQFAMIAPLRSHRTVGCWRRSRLRGVLRIGLSNPKCGKRNSFPHFGRRWPGLSTLSGSAGISLRFAQEALLERAGKLELFLQPAEGNRDHALLDALHHTCAKRFVRHGGTNGNAGNIRLRRWPRRPLRGRCGRNPGGAEGGLPVGRGLCGAADCGCMLWCGFGQFVRFLVRGGLCAKIGDIRHIPGAGCGRLLRSA